MSATAQRVAAWSSTGLAATVWLSASLFGLYILVFYALAVVTDDMARWNRTLPMYEPASDLGNASIGLHFAGGGVILVLGSIQFVQGIRHRWPSVHRWTGRVYVLASIAAGIGGLVFIGVHGTIGGTVMDVGFALYGVLMLLAAAQTARHALARRLEVHRAWAVRLYALALGSWLYRMGYGFWLLLADGAGHTSTFRGPFDLFMDFAFYVPPLLVAELWLRSSRPARSTALCWLSSGVMWVATGFVLLGTYFFTTELWVRAMADALLR